MGLFSCFCMSGKARGSSGNSSEKNEESDPKSGANSLQEISESQIVHENNRARSFQFCELSFVTGNFRDGNLIGQGGFGKVYKGTLGSGEAVAVRQLDREGRQGCNEFLTDVLMLSTLHHTNLVNLYGYCIEGDERLLVYEYMPNGSLDKHLFGNDLTYGRSPLDWNTRVKIALGAAKGLAYLHNTANPPIIYRDMKTANVLLDENFSPKLSDIGLAKVGPVGNKTHVSTSVMGTHGHCAPDYAKSGKLTIKSDIYSFGMFLLELLTGRKAYDPSRIGPGKQLLTWASPCLRDRRRSLKLADPLLGGRFPSRAFHLIIVIVTFCLQDSPDSRPVIADVVSSLEYVASQPYVQPADLNFMNSSSSSSSSSTSSSSSSSWNNNTMAYTCKRFFSNGNYNVPIINVQMGWSL